MSIYNAKPFGAMKGCLQMVTTVAMNSVFVICESLRVNVFWGGWVRIVQTESVSVLGIFGAVILLLLFLFSDFEAIWNILLYSFDDSFAKRIIWICVKVNCNFKMLWTWFLSSDIFALSSYCVWSHLWMMPYLVYCLKL